MSNLLEKASIITTPTAYDNGSLHSVKPVQSFGSELVINGTFDTDSDWTKNTGWSISGGTANYNDSSNGSLYQNITLNTNSYELKFSISNSSGSGARIWIGNSTGSVSYTDNTYQYYTNGDYTLTINVPSNQTTFAFWGNIGGSSFSIDNVSIKEVTDADFDFTRGTAATRVNSQGLIEDVQILSGELVQNGDFEQIGSELVINGNFDTDSDWSKDTGWTISNGEAIHTGSGSYISQTGTTIGKNYRVVIEVTQASGSGFPQIYMGGLTTAMTSPGTYTFNITATSTLIRLRGLNDCKVTSISVKELTEDVVVPYSGEGSLLLEGQSTNLITYSEDFNAWTKTGNTTISATNIISPSGQNNATLITGLDGTGSNDLKFNVGINTANKTFTFSVYLKGSGTLRLHLSNNIDNAASNVVTLTTSWVRYELTHTFNSTTSTSLSCVLDDSEGSTATEYNVFAAQLEELSYATSYIPTSGSTVTRNADVCNNAGSSDLINSTEGVLYTEFSCIANDGETRIISLSEDGNTNNRINIFQTSGSNKIKFTIRVNGTNVFNETVTLSNILNYNKFALSYKENGFKIYINGVKEEEQLSGSIYPANTLDKLNFDQGGGVFDFYGNVKSVAVFKEALTDEELTCLTS